MSPSPPSETGAGPSASLYLRQRPVRVLLRGNRSLEGHVHISEGQSLVGFLGMKKYFLNLTSVRWLDGRGGEGALPHLSIRISQIVWVEPADGDLPLSTGISPTGGAREVELQLIGDVTLHVTLGIADEMRMSDYFDSNPAFIPLRAARLGEGREPVERLAVNHEAILTIREL